MFEHNIFDKYCNDGFVNFLSNITMYMSIKIITLDELSTQFDILFILKLNHKHRKNLQC